MTTAATGLPDRFTTPLYTVMEAAQYLDVPASSLAAWTHGYGRNASGRPEPTATSERQSWPSSSWQ